MGLDLDAAVAFVATHARTLEWRRLHHLLGAVSSAEVVAALDAYRNPDGGYGWALEPDLRSVTSQPVAAMHALEVLAEIRDTDSRRATQLCDWLAEHSLADGGMPFSLPFSDTVGSAAHWTRADTTVSSLQMTTQLAAAGPAPYGHRRASLAGSGHVVLPGRDRGDRRDAARVRVDVHHALPRRRGAAQPSGAAAAGPDRALRARRRPDPRRWRRGRRGAVPTGLHVSGCAVPGLVRQGSHRRRPGPARRRATGRRRMGDHFHHGQSGAALEWRGYATVGAITVLRGAASPGPTSTR